MNNKFADIAFTPSVRAIQDSMGSRHLNARCEDGVGNSPPLGPGEVEFISRRDSFYMASVSETDWPYVQHRGGPPGFLKLVSPSTLGFADFRGNRQYVSIGNFTKNDRVALILVDYPNRERLKILGHARAIGPEESEALRSVKTPGYRGLIEHGLFIDVTAHDWNCPQHITPRYTETEIEAAVAPLRAHMANLEAELAACRAMNKSTDLVLPLNGVNRSRR